MEPSPSSISRAQFLRGDLRGQGSPIRPPWAPAEADFIEACERCDDCIHACPEAILVRGRGGFPRVNFDSAGCSFCGHCLDACAGRALTPSEKPWGLKAQISGNCLSLRGTVCRSCGERCEPGAIRFRLAIGGVARPIIDLDLCTGCGECLASCPVRAVTVQPMDTDAATLCGKENLA